MPTSQDGGGPLPPTLLPFQFPAPLQFQIMKPMWTRQQGASFQPRWVQLPIWGYWTRWSQEQQRWGHARVSSRDLSRPFKKPELLRLAEQPGGSHRLDDAQPPIKVHIQDGPSKRHAQPRGQSRSLESLLSLGKKPLAGPGQGQPPPNDQELPSQEETQPELKMQPVPLRRSQGHTSLFPEFLPTACIHLTELLSPPPGLKPPLLRILEKFERTGIMESLRQPTDYPTLQKKWDQERMDEDVVSCPPSGPSSSPLPLIPRIRVGDPGFTICPHVGGPYIAIGPPVHLTSLESNGMVTGGEASCPGINPGRPQTQIIRLIRKFLADEMKMDALRNGNGEAAQVCKLNLNSHRIKIKGVIEGVSNICWMFYVHIGLLTSRPFQDEVQNSLVTAPDWSATYIPYQEENGDYGARIFGHLTF